MKKVDYVVDGGDGKEIICDNKQKAIRIGQKLANKNNETICIYKWSRPDINSDLELNENFRLYVEPNKKG